MQPSKAQSNLERKAGVASTEPAPDAKLQEVHGQWSSIGDYALARQLVMDDVIAFMLATVESLPTETAVTMDRPAPGRLVAAIRYRIAHLEAEIQTRKDAASIASYKLRLEGQVSEQEVAFGDMYTPTPSSSDGAMLDKMHAYSVIVARLKAILFRLEQSGVLQLPATKDDDDRDNKRNTPNASSDGKANTASRTPAEIAKMPIVTFSSMEEFMGTLKYVVDNFQSVKADADTQYYEISMRDGGDNGKPPVVESMRAVPNPAKAKAKEADKQEAKDQGKLVDYPLVMNICQDIYGNIFALEADVDKPRKRSKSERQRQQSLPASTPSTDVKDGYPLPSEQPARKDKAKKPRKTAGPGNKFYYKSRSGLLSDLERDVTRVLDQIKILEQKRYSDEPYDMPEELKRQKQLTVLKQTYLRMQELIAEIHGQAVQGAEPQAYPGSIRADRKEQRRLWTHRANLVRREMAMRYEKGGKTVKLVRAIEARLMKLALQRITTVESKSAQDDIDGLIKIWNSWDGHVRPVEDANPELKEAGIPRGVLRHYFMQYRRVAYFLDVVLITHSKVTNTPSAGMPSRKSAIIDRIEKAMNEGTVSKVLALRSNRAIEHCVRDQLFVMCYVNRALVHRFWFLRDWICSGYVASLPQPVIEEHAWHILRYPHCISDMAPNILSLAGSESSEVRAYEEELPLWHQARARFPSSAAFEVYNARISDFLLKLAYFNRQLRASLCWLLDLVAEFQTFKVVQEAKEIAPMMLQLATWTTEASVEITTAIMSSNTAHPVVRKELKGIRDRVRLDTSKLAEMGGMQDWVSMWCNIPQEVLKLVPLKPLQFLSPLSMCCWGQTAAERGDMVYQDFTRAHLLVENKVGVINGQQGLAYEQLMDETSSPMAFARIRKIESVHRALSIDMINKEEKRSNSARAKALIYQDHPVDDKQRQYMLAMVREMWQFDKLRRKFLNLRAQSITKALWMAKPGSADANHLVWLSASLVVVDKEWEVNVLLDAELRAEWQKNCLAILRLSAELAKYAELYRVHAKHMGDITMPIDPVTLRHSLTAFEIKLREAVLRYEECGLSGNKPNLRRELQNVIMPDINLRIRERQNLWLELPSFIKDLVGQKPPVNDVIFIVSMKTLRDLVSPNDDTYFR